MGNKLSIPLSDDLFDFNKPSTKGVTASCYCCTQQMAVYLDNLNKLPLQKIEDDYFRIIICDNCEEDIATLKRKGIDNVSYDYLWLIQGGIEEELLMLEQHAGDVTLEDREKILYDLYVKIEKEIKEKMNEDYLTKLKEK
jgi:hypothetical protein